MEAHLRPAVPHTRPGMSGLTLVRALMALALLSGCKGSETAQARRLANPQTWSPERLTSVRGVPASEIEARMKEKLNGGRLPKIDSAQWGHTRRLYQAYGDNPLWLSADGLHKTRTKALTDAILAANADGMRMDDYPIGALAEAIAALKQTKTPTADQLATADVILTASYAALGEDLMTGQVDPRTVQQAWYVNQEVENLDSALVRNLRYEKLDLALATIRPADDDYSALSKELQRWRGIVANGGWKPVPDPGENLKPGAKASPALLAALRARLSVDGITVPADGNGSTAGTYDRSLAGAVAEFQTRHSINVDSSLGKETIDALNLPASYRLGQIAANMERYRWLPRSFGKTYIFVNIPAFRLEAYDTGQKVMDMKVIVGQEYQNRATPVFADSMETVVFKPYWNVPQGIAEKEIFPKGPGYLASQNMEVYNEGGRRALRQRPGPKNALGKVKFLFPNDFSIYLHDTPDQELFNKDVRAFSHGCIRVEKPAELAQWVLGWSPEKVRQAMVDGPENRGVKLPRKIPVYITYFTTFINNGQLYFGNDLYSRDDTLVPAVMPGALPGKEIVAAVQALRRIAGA